mgnify:CR=1 FL=1
MENRIKILPYERAKFDDGEVCVDEVSVTYTQNGDCTEDEEETQSITISTRNNGCARFINIKTENWSIDPFSDDFELILKDFCERASLEQDEKDS